MPDWAETRVPHPWQDFPAYDPTANTWRLNVTVLQPQLANLKYQDGIAAAVINKVAQKTEVSPS